MYLLSTTEIYCTVYHYIEPYILKPSCKQYFSKARGIEYKKKLTHERLEPPAATTAAATRPTTAVAPAAVAAATGTTPAVVAGAAGSGAAVPVVAAAAGAVTAPAVAGTCCYCGPVVLLLLRLPGGGAAHIVKDHTP